MAAKRLNNKSQIMDMIIIAGVVIAFITFIWFVAIASPDVDQNYIGQNQLAILQTAQKAEKALLYVDQAARIAVTQSIQDIASEGGVMQKQCGEYYGYNYWQSFAEGFTEDCEFADNPKECSGVQECYPKDLTFDLGILSNSHIETQMNSFVAAAGRSFSKINYLDYDIQITGSNPLIVQGIAREDIKIPIVVEVKGTVEVPETPSVAVPLSDLECNYCNDGKKNVRDLFGEERYNECKNNGRVCCKENCPPGSVFVPTLPEYKNQHRDFRDLGACAGSGKTVSSSGCGPTSTHMAFESMGLDISVESLFCSGGENKIYWPGGTVFNKLVQVAKKHLPNSKGYNKLTFDKMAEEIRQGHPIVLDIKQKNVPRSNSLNERCYATAGHYVNIVGAAENYLIVNDPATGSRSCNRDRTVGERQVWSKEFVNDISYYGVAMADGVGSIVKVATADSGGNEEEEVEITPSQETLVVSLSDSEKEKVERVNQYDEWIRKYSQEYGVSSNVVKAMITWESGGRPDAISYTGCVGLGQFCYGTAAGRGYTNIFEKVTSCNCGPGKRPCKEYHACTPENDDRFDPEKNIAATAKYLSNSYKAYDGNIYLIAISYNAGPGVANIIKEKMDGKLGTYKYIRSLLDEAVLRYYSEKKIKEVDTHMKMVAKYYAAFGGEVETPTLTEEGKTYAVRTIGEYSIAPSFTVELPYNMDEYGLIKQQVVGYGTNKGILDLVAECERQGEKVEECVAEAVEKVNKRQEMKDNGLKMSNGPCDPKENLWSDFVEDFGDCLDLEQDNCYCNITLDVPDFDEEIKMKAEKNSGTQIVLDDAENPLSYSFDGEIEEEKEFTVKDGKGVYYLRKEAGKIHVQDSKPEMDACGFQKRKFKFCVQSENNMHYYDAQTGKVKYKNIEYKFALEFPDAIPPPAVEDFKAEDRQKAESSIIFEWDAPKEKGVIVPDLNYYLIYCHPEGFFRRDGEIAYDALSFPYKIYARENGNLKEHIKTQVTSCESAGLEEGHEYYFAAVAVDTSNNKGPAKEITVMSIDDLAPGQVSITADGQSFETFGQVTASGNQMVVSWERPEKDEDGETECDDVKEYWVYVSEAMPDLAACGPDCRVITVTGDTFTVEPGKTYYIAVVAVDEVGNHLASTAEFQEPEQWDGLAVGECREDEDVAIVCESKVEAGEEANKFTIRVISLPFGAEETFPNALFSYCAMGDLYYQNKVRTFEGVSATEIESIKAGDRFKVSYEGTKEELLGSIHTQCRNTIISIE